MRNVKVFVKEDTVEGGIMRRIRVVVREDCPMCNGNKKVHIAVDHCEYLMVDCPNCNGKGWVEKEEDFEELLLDANVMFEPDNSDW